MLLKALSSIAFISGVFAGQATTTVRLFVHPSIRPYSHPSFVLVLVV